MLGNGNAEVCEEADISVCSDYCVVQGFGSENRTTTFFKLRDGNIGVKCGCFYGTLDEFIRQVKKTHKHTKYAEEYLLIASAVSTKFNIQIPKRIIFSTYLRRMISLIYS